MPLMRTLSMRVSHNLACPHRLATYIRSRAVRAGPRVSACSFNSARFAKRPALSAAQRERLVVVPDAALACTS